MPVHENTNAQRHQPPGRRPTGEAQRFGLGAFSEYSVFPQFVKLNRAAGSLAVLRPPKAAGFPAEGCVGEIVAVCGRGRRQGDTSFHVQEPGVGRVPRSRSTVDALRSRYLGSFSSVDLVLAKPVMDSRRTHPQLDGRGRDRLTGSDERNCSHSELGRERSWHEGSLSKRARSTHHFGLRNHGTRQEVNQTGGRPNRQIGLPKAQARAP